MKSKPINILLVEDNLGDIRLIQELLNEADNFNFNLIVSRNLLDGLRNINENKSDIVLLDLTLPDSNGLETINRTRDKAKHLPIIILTGFKDENFARKIVQAGAQDYIIKGEIESNTLVRSIYYAIDRHKMIQTIESLVQTLQKNENRLRKIIEENADSIIIVDKEGIVRFVNPIAEEFFGRKKEEFVGQHFGYPTTAEKNEITRIKNDGNIVIGDINAVEIEWEGELAKLLTIRDVTEQRVYEERLQESEKRYRDLFENSPYPIIILNKNGVIVDSNSVLEKLHVTNKEDVINKDIRNTPLIPPKYLASYNKIHRNLLKGIIPDPLEIKVVIKNVHQIWLKLNFSLISLGKLELIYVLIQNVTELKQSEQKVKRLGQILHEMNALIEHAPLAILLIDKSGKILRANQEAIDLFKYSETELLNFQFLALFNPENSEIINKHYNEDIYNLAEPNHLELSVQRKDGRLIDVEITSTIIKIANNIIIQSFFSDITERKNFGRNREKLLDQLIDSLEFKSKFLATISHELRTPLNVILGFSSLLLEEDYGEMNEKQHEFLQDIDSEAKHLKSLIDSILDLSLIEVSKFELNLEKFKLDRILKDLISIVNHLFIKKSLNFHTEGINEDIYIRADPLRFKQIFYNLIDNAIKFTENGIITFRCIEKSNHWEFQVEDTGIGIAREDYDIVFREFGRIESDVKKKISGSGLGLALTKRLVQLHGGEIWFESEVGNGTTFFFTIPKLKSQN